RTRAIDSYGFGVVPFSEDDPAKTLRPSLSFTVEEFARFEPSLARNPSTVTGSPILSEFLVQPRRINPAGLPNSISQLATFPLVSFTSMWKRACGLIHSTFVTGPVSVTGFSRSYSAAKEWWARTGTAARIRTVPTASTTEDRVFMGDLRAWPYFFAPT